MKNKIFSSLLLVFGMVTTIGCISQEETEIYPLSKSDMTFFVTPTTATVAATNAQQTIQVMSATSWTVSSDVSWMSVSPILGGASSVTANVTVSISDNFSLAERTGILTVANAYSKKIVTITQAAATPTTFPQISVSYSSNYVTNVEGHYVASGKVSECGVVYSTSNPSPTVNDTKVPMSSVPTNSIISVSLTDLESETLYYFRLYVISSLGTEYSEEGSFYSQRKPNTIIQF